MAASGLGGTFLAATTVFCNLLPAAVKVLEAGNTDWISQQSCTIEGGEKAVDSEVALEQAFIL